MQSIDTILLVISVILFILAAIGISSRVNLIAAGLAFYVLTHLI